MSERLFKSEDARRHDAASAVASDWRLLEDRGPPARSGCSIASAERSRSALPLPPPAPHGLRYGSSFPYSAVAAPSERARGLFSRHQHHAPQPHERRAWPQTAPDDDAPRRAIQYRAQEQQERQTDHGRQHADPHAWNESGEASQQRGAVLERMPSLGALLQRSSFPVDHRDSCVPWRRQRDRRDDHFARDEFRSRVSLGDVDASGASGPHERHSRGSSGFQHPASLPGLRRLPSLTERRSDSPASDLAYRYSWDRSASQEPARSSVTALASDISMSASATRESVHPSVPRLRSTSYDSPKRSVALPRRTASQARSFPTRAADARSLSTGSLAQSSVASSEEGESRVKVDTDAGPDAVASDATAPQRKKKKRKVRICTTPGCDKLVVDHGVCIRHGGGKRCNVEGCDCRAQNKGLCWKHGGYTICQVDGCDKRAKSRGMCWSHGGGTQCKTEGCEKIAVSRGRCWAHGGGKRCKLPDCQKPAALRMDDYCTEHYAAFRVTMTNAATRRRGGVDTRALYESWQ